MSEAAMKQEVATPETWTPSRRMRSAAVAERARVQRELRRIEVRRENLAEELAAITTVADELRDHLRVLNRFVHDQDPGVLEEEREPPPLRVIGGAQAYGGPRPMELLMGSRIRETAARVLAGTDKAHSPVHYRNWYELFRNHGFMPGGKDPLATFLTQLNRSPVVRRAGGPGMYTLDYDFPQTARQRLGDLRAEWQRTHEMPANADVEAIGVARRRRAELGSEIEAIERALEEALRSLGDNSVLPGAEPPA